MMELAINIDETTSWDDDSPGPRHVDGAGVTPMAGRDLVD